MRRWFTEGTQCFDLQGTYLSHGGLAFVMACFLVVFVEFYGYVPVARSLSEEERCRVRTQSHRRSDSMRMLVEDCVAMFYVRMGGAMGPFLS